MRRYFSIYLIPTAALGPGGFQPLPEMSIRSRKILSLRSRALPVRKADNFTAICGILNISQPYRSPRPVTGIALYFYILLNSINVVVDLNVV
jgi:hypothetical protein